MIYITLWTAVFLLGTSSTASIEEYEVSLDSRLSTKASNLSEYLLPSDIVPTHYDIKLIPYLYNFIFDGEVTITVNVLSSTNTIIIHQNDTNIDESSVTVRNLITNVSIPVISQRYEQQYHFYIIGLSSSLIAGQSYLIHMKYSGHLRDDMQGMFTSYYKDEDEVIIRLAATHFQPCRARRAFPSFDEPALKARFKISIARTNDTNSLTNMPVESTEYDPALNMIWDHFEETPMPLSTYLMAFAITDFTNITEGIFGMYQRPGAESQAEYSLSISNRTLQSLEDYTGLKFFLPKLDQIAVPDYQSGATEQWGLVTYRERLILFAENVSSAAHKQNIATVIAHEFAHMWFGNLVSPKWWNVLWLNEGFASYFEYFTAAEVEPTWRLEEQFVIRRFHSSLASDAVSTSHPVTVDVASPEEISAIFNAITYSKAAALIRMMKYMLTPGIFQRGLNRFLVNMGNSSADADDLFSALNDQYISEVSQPSFTVKTVMDTWTLQMGYPVITVNRCYQVGAILVSQKRFLLRPPDDNSDTHNYMWWVPLTYTVQGSLNFSDTDTKVWLTDTEAQKTIVPPGLNDEQWIIFNVQQAGFYRVNYDNRNWQLIAASLRTDDFGGIIPLNRANILDDCFNLARAGLLDYEVAFNVIGYLEKETDYIPWFTALSGFSYIERRLRGVGESDYNFFKIFLVKLLAKAYDNLGLEENPSDSHDIKLHRNQILTWACDLGVRSCIENSIVRFNNFMTDPVNNWIEPDLKSVIFCNALRYGGEIEWNFLWQRFLNFHNVSTEQTLILGILGCTTNETLAHRYMDLSLDRLSDIRAQDMSLAFPSVYNSHEIGVDFTINYLHQNYQRIRDFHNSVNAVVSLISTLSSIVTRRDQLNRVSNFIETNQGFLGPQGLIAARNSLQTAERNFAWVQNSGPSVMSFAKRQFSENYRLSATVMPDTYTVLLTPYLENNQFTFDGLVNIIINVVRDTSSIMLHVNELTIDDTSITVSHVSSSNITNVVHAGYIPEHQYYIIICSSQLLAGEQYELRINYMGELKDDMIGFYRSSYYVGNQERWLAATQFHPTHCRKVLPCFDEPGLKARFKISISRTPNYRSISNMPLIQSEEAGNGRMWDHFEETPPTATYLVAFMVSDFVNISNSHGNMTFWQREEAVSQAEYGQSISDLTMRVLENYTEVSYALPKMDQAAIPDFAFGAMENWGLVKYREQRVLFDPNYSTTLNKQGTATIIAHEFAHMWFGNLLTPDWWTYPWLNEGFATYYEFFTAAEVEPTWRLQEQFVVRVLQNAFASDGLESSRPANYDVTHHTQITAVFDSITYSKAASVIRMLEHIMGSETFRRGISRYLKAHSYGSVSPSDLYLELQAQLREDNPMTDIYITDVMSTWTNQMGYPVITVFRDYASKKATIIQERFLLRHDPNSTDTHDYKWWIPITYTSRSNASFSNTSPVSWVKPTDNRIILNDVAISEDWLIFNLQETGYYRVNYDNENWRLITEHLNSNDYDDIHPLNRAQLINDALNLARAGILNYSIALNVVTYLTREKDLIPWHSAFVAFNFLNIRLRSATAVQYERFQNFIRHLIQPLYYEIGFTENEADDHITKLLRSSLVSWACSLEVEDCITKSREEIYNQNTTSGYIIPADVASTAYCTALRHGGADEWNFVWNLYRTSTVASHQITLLNVLGCTTQEEILRSYLQMSITENSGIRRQDASNVFAAVYDNPVGVDIAFDFLTSNYQSISEFYGGMRAIGTILTGIAERLSTRAQADRLKTFIEENQNNLGNALLSSQTALASVEENLAWFDSYGDDITVWLDSYTFGAANQITINIISVIIPFFVVIMKL